MSPNRAPLNRPKVSARQIEAFRAVMLTGSTRGAAEVLCVTQPVISKLIAQLESRIGFPIFERRGNSIVPNEKATLLLADAHHVHDGIERFDRFAAKLRSDDKGRLTVYASPTLTSAVVPFILSTNVPPSTQGEVSIAARLIADMPADLLADSQSIGLSIWQSEAPGIACEVLASRQVLLLVNPQNPLAQRKHVTLADLRSEDLIVHRETLPIGQKVRDALHKHVPAWPVRFSVDSSEAAYALVQNDLGVAFVDAFSREYLHLRGLRTLEVDTDVFTDLCLLKSSFHKPNLQTQWFERAVRNWVRSE